MTKRLGHHEGGGVTVTLERRSSSDETYTVHRAHQSRSEALRLALEPFDPDEWRVRAITTPQTIYADLTHSRKLIDPVDRARGGADGRQLAWSIGGTIRPESSMLGLAGRREYL